MLFLLSCAFGPEDPELTPEPDELFNARYDAELCVELVGNPPFPEKSVLLLRTMNSMIESQVDIWGSPASAWRCTRTKLSLPRDVEAIPLLVDYVRIPPESEAQTVRVTLPGERSGQVSALSLDGKHFSLQVATREWMR
jgi:hypothetical protein